MDARKDRIGEHAVAHAPAWAITALGPVPGHPLDRLAWQRRAWDAATRDQRHLAVAADAELRRRHPGQQYPPLRSAEPPEITQAQRDDLTLTTGEQIRETGQWIKDLAAQHRTFAARLADRQSLTIPSEDPDYGDLGQAFPPWPAPARDAILQPPKPEIQPSARILERALDHDPDLEAAN